MKETQEPLPKPVAAVLERGAKIREARLLPSGWPFIDVAPGRIPESELIKELFKYKAELLNLFEELFDAISVDGPYNDFVVAAAVIDGRLTIAACLTNVDHEETPTDCHM